MTADVLIAISLGDKVLAQAMTSDLNKIEGNWYFKESALIDPSKFTLSKTKTTCPWKGEASYFNYTKDDGEVIKDIAWFYPHPKPGAEQVQGRVAFYIGNIPNLRVDVSSF